MKNHLRLINVTLLFSAIVLVITIGDFLALHDISHDYVSKYVVKFHGGTFSVALPQWTETPGEWAIVNFSVISRLGFLILNIITLVICSRAFRGRKNNDFEEGKAARDPGSAKLSFCF